MKNLTYETFAENLINEVPEFKPMLDEYILDNGEVLNHPLIAALREFSIQEYYRPIPLEDNDTVRRILSFVEKCMGSEDKELQELVAASFLEYWEADEASLKIRELMGPNLLSKLKRQEEWEPEGGWDMWRDRDLRSE